MGSTLETTLAAVISSPEARRHPGDLILAHEDALHRRRHAQLCPGGTRSAGERVRQRPQTALWQRQGIHPLRRGGTVQERDHGPR